MKRDEFDRRVGRKSRRGRIVIAADLAPFVTESGIEAVVWSVPNASSMGSTGPAFVLVSLPRLRCLEREMRA